MKSEKLFAINAVLLALALVSAPSVSAQTTKVIAADLNNPRGLNFGPEGALYGAEAGSGGAGPCEEGPEGERCFGMSGSI